MPHLYPELELCSVLDNYMIEDNIYNKSDDKIPLWEKIFSTSLILMIVSFIFHWEKIFEYSRNICVIIFVGFVITMIGGYFFIPHDKND